MSSGSTGEQKLVTHDETDFYKPAQFLCNKWELDASVSTIIKAESAVEEEEDEDVEPESILYDTGGEDIEVDFDEVVQIEDEDFE